MSLTTGPNAEGLWYVQTNSISVGSSVTIEFSAKLDSRNTNLNWISSMSIPFTTGVSGGNGIGNILYLGHDDIWLSNPTFGQRGPSAQLDTDNGFDVYRIEVSSPTLAGVANQVKVYYDNGATPVINGTLSADFNLTGTVRRFGFGDSTGGDSGTSEWQYFWHNGSAIAIGEVPEPSVITLVSAATGLLARRNNRRRKQETPILNLR